MTKLLFPENCENSPKSKMVTEFYKELFAFNIDEVLGMVSDTFIYVIYGDSDYEGKEGIQKLLAAMTELKATEMNTQNVISHGKYAAVNGSITFENGSQMAFAEFITFSSHSKDSKISKVESYTVEVDTV